MTIKFIDENGVTKTPNDFSLAVLPNHEHEAIPETIDRTLSIPERDGLLYYGSNLGTREFNIPMIVIPQNERFQVQAKIREFSSFMFDGYGKPKKIKLIFDYEPDKFYYIRFSGRMVPERLYRMAEFDLPVIAYDPFAYSTTTNNEVTWGSEEITFNSSYLMGHEGGQIFTVTSKKDMNVVVSGSKNVSPLITVKGSGNGVKVSANGKIMSLGNFSNEEFIINGENFTVTKNGSETFLLDNFIDLIYGDNQVSVSGKNMNFTIQFTFRDKYL
jgi:predicted phage tail component-like protein